MSCVSLFLHRTARFPSRRERSYALRVWRPMDYRRHRELCDVQQRPVIKERYGLAGTGASCHRPQPRQRLLHPLWSAVRKRQSYRRLQLLHEGHGQSQTLVHLHHGLSRRLQGHPLPPVQRNRRLADMGSPSAKISLSAKIKRKFYTYS